MLEFLRAIRVGAVNLFGVAIPGFLLLFSAAFGFLAPVCAVVLITIGAPLNRISGLYEHNHLLVIAMFILFSYVTGYILRLTSPDRLDQESGRRVLERMKEREPDELRDWPYTGLESDKFPYLKLRRYLKARGLEHLLGHVQWDYSDETGKQTNGKRSKTAVHEMKLKIRLHVPELAAEVESNEAHIGRANSFL